MDASVRDEDTVDAVCMGAALLRESTGPSQVSVHENVCALQAFVWARKRAYAPRLPAPEDPISKLPEVRREAQKPVVLGFSDYNPAAAGRWKG